MRALTRDEFDGREGETFELDLDGRTIDITLTKTYALPDSGRDGGAFVLEWLGPYEPVLPQAIFTFRDKQGEFEMFIVAIGRDRAGTRYEAVFN